MKCKRCNKEFDSFPNPRQNLCKKCLDWLAKNGKESDDCIILKCEICHSFVGYLHIEDVGVVNAREIKQVFNTNDIYIACPKCIVKQSEWKK